MAGFCMKCGAPLGEAKFCTSCGAAAGTPTVIAPGAPVAAAPPAKSGGGMKILFIVLGIFALLFTMAMGSCLYFGYQVKKKAQQFAAETRNTPAYRGTRDACSVITAADVSEALGVPAEMSDESSSTSCHFKYGAAGSKTLAVDFTWEGGALAMKFANAAMGHIAGQQTFTPVRGLGDEAYIAPMGSGLMMRKGDVMVHIDTRLADLNVDAAKKIAARIANRL